MKFKLFLNFQKRLAILKICVIIDRQTKLAHISRDGAVGSSSGEVASASGGRSSERNEAPRSKFIGFSRSKLWAPQEGKQMQGICENEPPSVSI